MKIAGHPFAPGTQVEVVANRLSASPSRKPVFHETATVTKGGNLSLKEKPEPGPYVASGETKSPLTGDLAPLDFCFEVPAK